MIFIPLYNWQLFSFLVINLTIILPMAISHYNNNLLTLVIMISLIRPDLLTLLIHHEVHFCFLIQNLFFPIIFLLIH